MTPTLHGSKTCLTTLVTLSLAICACGGRSTGGDDPVDGVDAGRTDAGRTDASSTSCEPGIPRMTPGSTVEFSSTPAGNPQRDYCLVVPASSMAIRLNLTGGTCSVGNCLGDDVELHLKRGSIPNAFEPDGQTTSWTYTPAPNGSGVFGKAAQDGVWYLSLIDGANSLGYSGVRMSVQFP